MKLLVVLIFLLLGQSLYATSGGNMQQNKIDREELLEYPIYTPIRYQNIDMGIDHSQNVNDIAVENPNSLMGKKVGIIISHGITEIEFTYAYDFLVKRGATVDILAPWWIMEYSQGQVHLTRFLKPTFNVSATKSLREVAAKASLYDALIIPGGAWATQVLRQDADALKLLKFHLSKNRLLALNCSGPQVLIDSGLINGMEIAASSSIRTDLINAGAKFIDNGVHLFKNIISSKGPADLPGMMVTLKEYL